MAESREHVTRAREFLRMALQLSELSQQFANRATAELELAEVEREVVRELAPAALADVESVERYLAEPGSCSTVDRFLSPDERRSRCTVSYEGR
ncbi:hypothetical protein ACFS2C_11855 [Prauserella oleivorans]|uniref:Uncharacterized protein n=1 Tax=Prauserella oleivorans TaxID=1478153 RepID=A0ABW5W9B2_9PSEU